MGQTKIEAALSIVNSLRVSALDILHAAEMKKMKKTKKRKRKKTKKRKKMKKKRRDCCQRHDDTIKATPHS